MPLILRGARQVGKTYIVQEFGSKEFDSFLAINFESDPNYKECFESTDFSSMLRSIELISRQKIVPGKTLVFFDEIQACPKALQILRYFKEKYLNFTLLQQDRFSNFLCNKKDFLFP